MNSKLLESWIDDFTNNGQKISLNNYEEGYETYRKKLEKDIVLYNSCDVLRCVEFILVPALKVSEDDNESCIKFITLLNKAYDTPTKSKGLTTPIASQLLAYSYPDAFAVFRDPITRKLLMELQFPYPSIKIDKAYSIHVRKYMKIILQALKTKIADADYVLVDIFFSFIANRFQFKEKLSNKDRTSDNTCLKQVMELLDGIPESVSEKMRAFTIAKINEINPNPSLAMDYVQEFLEIEDVLPSDEATIFDNLPPGLYEATEGRRRISQHISRERDKAIVNEKKKNVLHKEGSLTCEACEFDFAIAFKKNNL